MRNSDVCGKDSRVTTIMFDSFVEYFGSIKEDPAIIYKIINALPKEVREVYFAERRQHNYEVPVGKGVDKSSLMGGLNEETESNIRQRYDDFIERKARNQLYALGGYEHLEKHISEFR